MYPTPLTHAEARELIEASFAVPADATTLAAGEAGAALDAHLAECAECAAEYGWLRATAAAVQLHLGPPPAMRARVLGSVTGAARDAAPAVRGDRATTRLVSFPRALAAAAALGVLAFLAGALAGLNLAPRDDDSALARAAMVMAELAADPATQAMTLRDPSGAPGGSLLYQPASGTIVVFSESLAPPATGGYDCYLERDGERTRIGPMLFESGTAFWAGPARMPDLGRPGDRFVVLADAADATPMLSASF